MIARTISVLAAATLTLAACGSSGDDATSTDTASVTPPTTAEEPMSGDPSPDVPPSSGAFVPDLLQFRSPLVGGGELDAATTAGTPTLFWFWSPT